jgi:hypothetical protein
MWNVLFFGLKKAITHFQQIAEKTIKLIRKRIVAYFDNFLIRSKASEHLENVKKVINALTNTGFQLNPNNCKVGFAKIQFIKAFINESLKVADLLKVKVLQEMNRLKTKKKLKLLLGFVNLLCNFILLYACIVGPLERLKKIKKILEDI